jgi:hypothetical protein
MLQQITWLSMLVDWGLVQEFSGGRGPMAAQPHHNGGWSRLEAAPRLHFGWQPPIPSPPLLIFSVIFTILFFIIVLRVIRFATMTSEEGINDGNGGGAPSTTAGCCCRFRHGGIVGGGGGRGWDAIEGWSRSEGEG